ncbi:MAG: toll/interleukin-1 receptor domain-containing protein [Elusimicrobia bacterium]|nr:toll/interleukin-1 receptor domain-containing protein [Elusimicrobiota bacterium]
MKNENAIKYIENLIKGLVPTANVNHYETPVPDTDYDFRIEINSNAIIIKFTQEMVEDFENLINKPTDKNQYNDLKSRIDFKIYFELGKEGVIRPDFKVSQKLLEEKREWVKDYRVNVEFNETINNIIYNGLLKLESFLNNIINTYKTSNKGIKNEKNYISNLIAYFKKNKSFSDNGVGDESLGFLKAAVIAEIIEKEKIRKDTTIQRIKDDINKEIYNIVSMLRGIHFVDIKLPECIKDYAMNHENIKNDSSFTDIQKKDTSVNKKENSHNALNNKLAIGIEDKLRATTKYKRRKKSVKIKSCCVFISYSTINKGIAGNIKSELEQYGIVSFLAHHDITPSSIWKNKIIYELRHCKFFIPIITSDFRGSKWTDQESGIAFIYKKEILPVKVQDIDPYGFLDIFQAIPLKGNDYAELCRGIAYQVFTKSKDKITKINIKKRVINIFRNSGSYRGVEENVRELSKYGNFTKSQINEIFKAILSNNQILPAADVIEPIKALVKKYKRNIDKHNLKKLDDYMEKNKKDE